MTHLPFGLQPDPRLPPGEDAMVSHGQPLTAAIAVKTKPVGDWVMVPREPTEAMLDNVVVRMDEEGFVPNDVAAEIYAAMLTAAPSSPQPLLDAPEILSALKQARYVLAGLCGEDPDILGDIDRAIAKATGKP